MRPRCYRLMARPILSSLHTSSSSQIDRLEHTLQLIEKQRNTSRQNHPIPPSPRFHSNRDAKRYSSRDDLVLIVTRKGAYHKTNWYRPFLQELSMLQKQGRNSCIISEMSLQNEALPRVPSRPLGGGKNKRRVRQIALTHPPFVYCDRTGRLLSVVLVGHRQLLAALGTTRSEYTTTILRCHSLAETVLVHAATVVRLKCSFHLFMLILIYYCFNFKGHRYPRLGCKITHNFRNNKELNDFSPTNRCFFVK